MRTGRQFGLLCSERVAPAHVTRPNRLQTRHLQIAAAIVLAAISACQEKLPDDDKFAVVTANDATGGAGQDVAPDASAADQASGADAAAPCVDGKDCDDGDPCTVGDKCGAGSCQPGAKKECDDGKVCTDDACDSATGDCATKPVPGALTCDDGSACTSGDKCAGGDCVGVAVDCDDKNPCTADGCDMAAGCTSVDADGIACDDDNPCTVGDLCDFRLCEPGEPKPCDSDDPCKNGKCNLVDGKCQFSDKPEGSYCDDDSACTKGDTCKGGNCAGKALDCNDDNSCTDDSCDPDKGCVAVANAENCDADGNACTVGDGCKDKLCLKGKAKVCNDDEACTFDSCNKTSGDCVFEGGPLKGQPCDADGNKCTDNDSCKQGSCKPGAATVCDDGNACTDDACDPKKGCVTTNNSATCDDGDACTEADACAAGQCKAGKVKSCDDSNPCTTDTCDAKQGCVAKVVADATSCGEGNWCQAGKCEKKEFCGDNKKNAPGEQCDDGNTKDNDGCSSKCKLEGSPMVSVPGGPFWMGCNKAKDGACDADEKPQHLVKLSTYWIDVYETTVAEYSQCVKAGPCSLPSKDLSQCVKYPSMQNWGKKDRGKHPINCVDQSQAKTYCKWRGKRLPTEAEWEKAARGGCELYTKDCAKQTPTFPAGNDTPTCKNTVMFGNKSGCDKGTTAPVGVKSAGKSPYGVYDMAGNVWELVSDWYAADYYANSPTVNPKGPASGSSIVLRPGGFRDKWFKQRAGDRNWGGADYASVEVGFRCAKDGK